MGTAQLGMAGNLPICLLAVQPWGICNCCELRRRSVVFLGQEHAL
jgi:hypothetical protein